jgi:formylglycine-generating enzyme required for sulfatase activity
MPASQRAVALPLVGSMIFAACGGGNAASQLAKAPDFNPKDQTKCGVEKSQAKPLIVEWPSADRGELEAQAHNRGLVVVRYQGCEMQVLDHCTTTVKYSYSSITRKKDRVVMRDADDLYANVPVGAAKLEAKLEKSGELDVDMTMVGRWEADRSAVRSDELQGSCDGATHVVSALTVGAFTFTAGADATVGGGATLLGAGGGGQSTSKRETLNADGDVGACEKSTPDDKTPPPNCGAMLRVEVVPLVGAQPATASASGSNGSCPEGMAFLPGGTFTMGDRKDNVTVQPFCMDVTEVTVGAYAVCAKSGQCSPAATAADWPNISDAERTKWSPYCNGSRTDRSDHPVNCVDWAQSATYCHALGKRLPTEEEWEWAARGGSQGRVYPWGNAAPDFQLCWGGMRNRDGTCAVGSFPAGDAAGGIHDLSGNVWEWTASDFDASTRVQRGGSWLPWLGASSVRAAFRMGAPTGGRNVNLGFRCAR